MCYMLFEASLFRISVIYDSSPKFYKDKQHLMLQQYSSDVFKFVVKHIYLLYASAWLYVKKGNEPVINDAIYSAIHYGNMDFLKLVVKHKIDFPDLSIIHAAKNNGFEVAKFLLANGATIGRDEVAIAAGFGEYKEAKFLLENGGKINDNFLPIFITNGRFGAAEFLIQNGAKISPSDICNAVYKNTLNDKSSEFYEGKGFKIDDYKKPCKPITDNQGVTPLSKETSFNGNLNESIEITGDAIDPVA